MLLGLPTYLCGKKIECILLSSVKCTVQQFSLRPVLLLSPFFGHEPAGNSSLNVAVFGVSHTLVHCVKEHSELV